MPVDETIQRAERWMTKLQIAAKNSDRQEIEDCFNPLLTTTRSILDHLLEDYNQKYDLNIPLESRGFWREFRKRISEKEIGFLSYYDELWAVIKNNSTCSVLMEKRNLDVHRMPQKTNKIVVVANEYVTSTSHVSVMTHPVGTSPEDALKISRKIMDEKMRITQELAKKNDPRPKSNTSVSYCFQEIDGMTAVEACEKFLNIMKIFVESMRKEY
jgi:hypothetical protein